MHPSSADLAAIASEKRWDDLGWVIDTHFFALSMLDEENLWRAVEAAPEEWLDAHPRYFLAREILRFRRGKTKLFDPIVWDRFAHWVQTSPDAKTRDRVAIPITEATRMVAAGNYSLANQRADEALAIIRSAADRHGLPDVLPDTLVRVGMTKLHAGLLAEAVAAFFEAVRWSDGPSPHPMAPAARAAAALALALAGQFRTAQTVVRDDPPQGWVAWHGSLHPLVRLLIAQADLDTEAVAAGLRELDPRGAAHELWWVEAHLRARHALHTRDFWGDIYALENILVAQKGRTEPDSYPGLRLRIDLADLHTAAGDLTTAAFVLDAPGLNTASPLHAVARARLDLFRGEVETALARLEAALSPSSSSTPAPHQAALLMMMSSAEMQAGDVSHARTTLAAAYGRMRSEGAMFLVREAPSNIHADLIRLVNASDRDTDPLFDSSLLSELTAREREVLTALRTCTDTKHLAEALYISRNTAKSHVHSIYRKLGVHNRAEALSRADRLGL